MAQRYRSLRARGGLTSLSNAGGMGVMRL
jgi:hypothetical protein